MKRILSVALCLLLMLSILLPAGADGTIEGWYEVSAYPRDYAYLYSEASDRDGMSINLGRYNNGDRVYVLNYYGGRDGSYNYCYVRTMTGKLGYMHDYVLKPYRSDPMSGYEPGIYLLCSKDPNGYAYLYDQPSDRTGRNLGRYDNGEFVQVINYFGGSDGGNHYCYVQMQDGKEGYVHDSAILPVNGKDDRSGWYEVNSSQPWGYAYLYSQGSDRFGTNLGRYNNGDWVFVMDYEGGKDGSWNYCYVMGNDGRWGFMHDYALRKVD